MISGGGTPLEVAEGVVSMGVALVAVPVGLFVAFLLVMTEPVDPRDAPDSRYALVVGRAFDGPDGLLTAPGSKRDVIGYQYRVREESAYVGQ
ncbi:hypothetical protein [Natrinema sp. SYSU A 869]|uniref:hypothetical protein n=1 Tax=Natrinema sp. SYSU A 869 TaxID=2871694 RepID=UPI001CA3A112|nr:hypothetical protein [Natrinema sp. SYSU A 869]